MHAERRTRGQHRIHRIGTLERSVRSQIRVCHRQARADRSREDGCEGGAPYGIRANVVCPGFVRTPLVEKQIPEQARVLRMSESDVVKNVMLKETVDGQFTTVDDVADVTLMFANFPSNALTGQSMVVSHGWFMQ